MKSIVATSLVFSLGVISVPAKAEPGWSVSLSDSARKMKTCSFSIKNKSGFRFEISFIPDVLRMRRGLKSKATLSFASENLPIRRDTFPRKYKVVAASNQSKWLTGNTILKESIRKQNRLYSEKRHIDYRLSTSVEKMIDFLSETDGKEISIYALEIEKENLRGETSVVSFRSIGFEDPLGKCRAHMKF